MILSFSVINQKLTDPIIHIVEKSQNYYSAFFTFNGWDDIPARCAIFRVVGTSGVIPMILSNDACKIPNAVCTARFAQVAVVGGSAEDIAAVAAGTAVSESGTIITTNCIDIRLGRTIDTTTIIDDTAADNPFNAFLQQLAQKIITISDYATAAKASADAAAVSEQQTKSDVDAVDQAEKTAVTGINDAEKAAVSDITKSKTAAIVDIGTEKDAAITAISNEKDTAVNAVDTEKKAALTTVGEQVTAAKTSADAAAASAAAAKTSEDNAAATKTAIDDEVGGFNTQIVNENKARIDADNTIKENIDEIKENKQNGVWQKIYDYTVVESDSDAATKLTAVSFTCAVPMQWLRVKIVVPPNTVLTKSNYIGITVTDTFNNTQLFYIYNGISGSSTEAMKIVTDLKKYKGVKDFDIETHLGASPAVLYPQPQHNMVGDPDGTSVINFNKVKIESYAGVYPTGTRIYVSGLPY